MLELTKVKVYVYKLTEDYITYLTKSKSEPPKKKKKKFNKDENKDDIINSIKSDYTNVILLSTIILIKKFNYIC